LGNPAAAPQRADRLLSAVIYNQSTMQAIIDSFMVVAALTAIAMMVLASCKGAPQGPASHGPLFRGKSADAA
jgi:hypothetical protein